MEPFKSKTHNCRSGPVALQTFIFHKSCRYTDYVLLEKKRDDNNNSHETQSINLLALQLLAYNHNLTQI